MSDLLVLPSARLIEPDLQADFGPIPPALIPLDGIPAFRRIATSVNPTHLVIAAHQGIALVDEYLAHNPDPAVTLLDVGSTTSLGHTIAVAMRSLDLTTIDRLVINFADTLVADLPSHGDVICARTLTRAERWTAFTFEDGVISTVVEKDIDKPNASSLVFVGVFAITQPSTFARMLDRQLLHIDDTVDPFYRALQEYSVPRSFTTHEPRTWHDFGHLDTYYDTRQRFYVNRRAFNNVEIDTTRGCIRKSSDNERKLADEIAWYLDLPLDIAPFAPRVFDYDLEAGTTYANLEFYGYPPLAESYLHGAWPAGIWVQAFAALGHTIDTMSMHTTLNGAEFNATRRNRLHTMYVTKTLERLATIDTLGRLSAFASPAVTINDHVSAGIATVRRTLSTLAEAARLCEVNQLSVMHGDLCLSNILFDRRTSIVRLIDPRGSFGGGRSIHGDPRYDLAKLSHSINGNYDHYLHDMFDLHIDDDHITLDAHINERQQVVKAEFGAWLQSRCGEDLARVRLIESLLFLSMVPLHVDRPRSQAAFLTQGLASYTQALHHWMPEYVTEHFDASPAVTFSVPR